MKPVSCIMYNDLVEVLSANLPGSDSHHKSVFVHTKRSLLIKVDLRILRLFLS